MSAQHTPGPWVAVEEDGEWIIGCDDYLGRHVAYLSNGGVPEDEEPANANLIAASPDLLEALDAVRRVLPETLKQHDLFQAVEDAIAKATGAA